MDTATQLQAAIGDLESIGSDYEAEIDRLNLAIEARDDDIQMLKDDIEVRDELIGNLEREVEALQAELARAEGGA